MNNFLIIFYYIKLIIINTYKKDIKNIKYKNTVYN